MLLELPVLLLQGPALPLLEEMANRVMGNKGAVVGPMQVRRQSGSFLTSATKAASVGLLLRCFTDTGLKLRNWDYGLILLP